MKCNILCFVNVIQKSFIQLIKKIMYKLKRNYFELHATSLTSQPSFYFLYHTGTHQPYYSLARTSKNSVLSVMVVCRFHIILIYQVVRKAIYTFFYWENHCMYTINNEFILIFRTLSVFAKKF